MALISCADEKGRGTCAEPAELRLGRSRSDQTCLPDVDVSFPKKPPSRNPANEQSSIPPLHTNEPSTIPSIKRPSL